jgi:hypothetical protein
MKIANERVTLRDDDDRSSASVKWTRQFSIEMNKLAASLLRQKNGDSR